MKKTIFIPLALVFVATLFQACNDEVFCTDIFAMAGVTIHGDQPDETYTVRKTTGDTLYGDRKLNDSLYLILDDTFLPQLKSSSDIFIFHAFIDDSLVAKEEYLISADECHIRLVEGKHEIDVKK